MSPIGSCDSRRPEPPKPDYTHIVIKSDGSFTKADSVGDVIKLVASISASDVVTVTGIVRIYKSGTVEYLVPEMRGGKLILEMTTLNDMRSDYNHTFK